MMVVIKMRRSPHSIDMREFEITSEGFVIGERLTGYRGLTTGVPGPWNDGPGEIHESMDEPESNQ
jgi:circadian clock protein KaiC